MLNNYPIDRIVPKTAILSNLIAIKRPVTIPEIIKVVSIVTQTYLHEVIGRRRHAEIVLARQLICYFAWEWTSISSERIGIYMGGLSHCSVLHGKNKIKEQLDPKAHNKQVRDFVSRIERTLNLSYRKVIRPKNTSWNKGLTTKNKC